MNLNTTTPNMTPGGRAQDLALPVESIAGHAVEGFIIVALSLVLIVLCCRRRPCSCNCCCRRKPEKGPTDIMTSVSVHGSTDSILTAIVVEPLASTEEEKSPGHNTTLPAKACVGPLAASPLGDNYVVMGTNPSSCREAYENFPASDGAQEKKTPLHSVVDLVFNNELDVLPDTDPESPSYTSIDPPRNSFYRPKVTNSAPLLSQCVSTPDYENIPKDSEDVSLKEQHLVPGCDSDPTQGYFSMEPRSQKQVHQHLDQSEAGDQGYAETNQACYYNVMVNTPRGSRGSKVSEKADDDDSDEDDDGYLHPISSAASLNPLTTATA